MVLLRDVLGEHGRKVPGIADDLLIADLLDHVHGARFLVQAISDHERGAGRVRGVNDGLAVLHRRFHGLLEQHVQPGRERRLGEFAVPEHGGGNVDGVDVAGGQQCRVFLVGIRGHPELPAELLGFLRAGGHQRREFCVIDPGQPRDESLLGNLTYAHHGKAHGAVVLLGHVKPPKGCRRHAASVSVLVRTTDPTLRAAPRLVRRRSPSAHTARSEVPRPSFLRAYRRGEIGHPQEKSRAFSSTGMAVRVFSTRPRSRSTTR